MKPFNLGDRRIRIWWSYDGAVTRCHLAINEEIQHNGYALCSSVDTYTKEKGRKVSLRRALFLAGFDKNERTVVWSRYHTRGYELSPDLLFISAYLSDSELEHLSFDDAMALAVERDKHSAVSLMMSMES